MAERPGDLPRLPLRRRARARWPRPPRSCVAGPAGAAQHRRSRPAADPVGRRRRPRLPAPRRRTASCAAAGRTTPLPGTDPAIGGGRHRRDPAAARSRSCSRDDSRAGRPGAAPRAPTRWRSPAQLARLARRARRAATCIERAQHRRPGAPGAGRALARPSSAAPARPPEPRRRPASSTRARSRSENGSSSDVLGAKRRRRRRSLLRSRVDAALEPGDRRAARCSTCAAPRAATG